MTDEMIPPQRYVSLEEIRQRKKQLRNLLRKDSEQMKAKAQTLFHKEEGEKMPTQRLMGVMSKGAGFIDGAILVWKLYQKFHRPNKNGKKKSGGWSLFGKKKKK